MALQNNTILDGGVTLSNCYVRINSVEAYNEIKNRKGEMINGTFVKNER